MLDRYTKFLFAAGLCLFATTASAFEQSVVEVTEPRTIPGSYAQPVNIDDAPAADMPGDEAAEPGAELMYPGPGSSQQVEPMADSSAANSSANGNSCNQSDECGSKHGKQHPGKFMTDYYNCVGWPGARGPRPFGDAVNAAMDAQIRNGLAAQMILYEYDFQQPELDPDPSKLISHGYRRLARMASFVTTHPVPLVIESSGDNELDRARRRNVLAALQRMVPVPVQPETVIVATPTVRGIQGLETELINDNLLLQTRQRGLSTLPSVPGRILSPILTAPQITPGNDD